jgi:hypothetical protein
MNLAILLLAGVPAAEDPHWGMELYPAATDTTARLQRPVNEILPLGN